MIYNIYRLHGLYQKYRYLVNVIWYVILYDVFAFVQY